MTIGELPEAFQVSPQNSGSRRGANANLPLLRCAFLVAVFEKSLTWRQGCPSRLRQGVGGREWGQVDGDRGRIWAVMLGRGAVLLLEDGPAKRPSCLFFVGCSVLLPVRGAIGRDI